MNASSATELVSCISAEGHLRLTLQETPLREPGADEVVVDVQAAPVNPSDLLLMLGPVDMASLRQDGTPGQPVVEGEVPQRLLPGLQARLDQTLSVGNEGAGVVVGVGSTVRHLMGRMVAFRAQEGSYATRRVVPVRDCIVMPDGTSARAAASAFINPLTALCMVETLLREHHTALVHTAAASNLGQMLVRLCKAEGIPLVNVVRSPAQVELLRGLGADHVLDSTAPGFDDALAGAIRQTGATLAFDAVGGGTLASTILAAMERVEREKLSTYSRYGSPVHKQVYIYGLLDPGPRVINPNVGTAWGVGGWLMSWVLASLEPGVVEGLKRRVASELDTTFASHYAGGFGLAEILTLDAIAKVTKRATNHKYLVLPNGELP